MDADFIMTFLEREYSTDVPSGFSCIVIGHPRRHQSLPLCWYYVVSGEKAICGTIEYDSRWTIFRGRQRSIVTHLRKSHNRSYSSTALFAIWNEIDHACEFHELMGVLPCWSALAIEAKVRYRDYVSRGVASFFDPILAQLRESGQKRL